MTPRTRKALAKRFNGCCVYCANRLGVKWTVDHVIPRRHGGSDFRWNLVPSCLRCNTSKGCGDPPRVQLRCARHIFDQLVALNYLRQVRVGEYALVGRA
jgi:5-methylcytosine-specific restriction endonuclease McrA